ncbi:unnamed protein product [Brassicogethes aeneus]|uniref:Exoribonuclease phosphorolytic domain-containing protein n=1 Tax=Brassicogethes aeneus TaxID=1431903 RepID=A0A9P0AY40_BRAAE|nr:unnamed protein product [Brassicogethes aeneus]
MTIDHKRINGPEETIPYELFQKLNTKSLTTQFNECSKDGIRKDKRKTDEHRKIFITTGVVSQAKGSSYIELGNTKVIVSVFDPREIPNRTDYSLKGEIDCEFKFAPFSCPKRKLQQQDSEEKHYSAIMKQALESAVCRHEFPNFQVDIYALVLHNGGSALSAAIIAAGLALSHAGVPMYDLITSVTLGLQNGEKLVDLTLEEETLCLSPIADSKSHGIVVLSLLSTHEQVSQFFQTGNLTLEDVVECTHLLTKACKDIVPLIQKTLAKHVVKNVKESI